METFSKILSANDVGTTGAHQAGIYIPKSQVELLSILPSLDGLMKNPDAWVECLDENKELHNFRFIYYNNKYHDEGGTRDEYRITRMTRYFKQAFACEGDSFQISKCEKTLHYLIKILKTEKNNVIDVEEDGVRIRIKSGWTRLH